MDVVSEMWRDVPWVAKAAGGTILAGLLVLIVWKKRQNSKSRLSVFFCIFIQFI